MKCHPNKKFNAGKETLDAQAQVKTWMNWIDDENEKGKYRNSLNDLNECMFANEETAKNHSWSFTANEANEKSLHVGTVTDDTVPILFSSLE